MIPILYKVYNPSGRLLRGTRVSLRYSGATWHASTSSRGVIETWYFNKVVAEDIDSKCSITVKQEKSYGYNLITHYFSASRTELHLVILYLEPNCGPPSFRLISKPLGSTHALLLRSSLDTQGGRPILTKIDKVRNKQASQHDTETSQTLRFGSGGSFSSPLSRGQGRAESGGAAISVVSEAPSGSASSSNPLTGNQPILGIAAASSSSGGLFGSASSSSLLTQNRPGPSNAMAPTLSGGGLFGLGTTSSGREL